MYRFLLTGRWILAFFLCILFSLLCVYLAHWQMDRKHAMDYTNSRIARNYHAPAKDFAAVGQDFTHFDPDLQWQPVRMTGHYRTADQVLVRNRPLDGEVGYEVLVPFTTEQGTTVVIDRGWVPAGDQDADPASAVPAPPAGTVTVVARIHAGEASTGKSAPAGQIQSIDLPGYAARLHYRIAQGAYGIMASEQPAPASRPKSLSEPEQDVGPNLSYSMQWYAFAVLVYVAYGWSARQKVRNDRLDAELAAELEQYYRRFYAEDGTYIGDVDESVLRRQMDMIDDMPAHMKTIVRPKPQKTRRRPTDEEYEDALLDAASSEDARPGSQEGAGPGAV